MRGPGCRREGLRPGDGTASPTPGPNNNLGSESPDGITNVAFNLPRWDNNLSRRETNPNQLFLSYESVIGNNVFQVVYWLNRKFLF